MNTNRQIPQTKYILHPPTKCDECWVWRQSDKMARTSNITAELNLNDTKTTGPITEMSWCTSIVELNYPIYIIFFLCPEIIATVFESILSYVIYQTVEIHHPQFFLLFQNHVVSLITSSISFTMQFTNHWVNIQCFNMYYFLLNFISFQFHLITWMTVSILRYELIGGHKSQRLLDFDKLKMKTTALTWLFFLLIFCLVNATGRGWRILFRQHPVVDIKVVLGLNYYFWTSAPLLVSAVIYVILMKRIKQRRRSIGPIEMKSISSSVSTANDNNESQQNCQVSVSSLLSMIMTLILDSWMLQSRRALVERFRLEEASALLGLKTNFGMSIILLTIVVSDLCTHSTISKMAIFLSCASVSKTLVPAVTAISNFKMIEKGLRKFPFLSFFLPKNNL